MAILSLFENDLKKTVRQQVRLVNKVLKLVTLKSYNLILAIGLCSRA